MTRRAFPALRVVSRGTPWVAVAALAAMLSMGCAGRAERDAAALSPLHAPADDWHHVGKIVYLRLVTTDLPAAKAFYAGMFGWSFKDAVVDGNDYAEATLGGHHVADIVRTDAAPAGRGPAAWLPFISATDVDAVNKLARQGGATLLTAPHDVHNRGREAILSDPQGAVFAVLASSSGDPPDTLSVPGDWIWSSLVTGDPGAGAAFYRALFGYDGSDAMTETRVRHVMLATDDVARASVHSMDMPSVDTHAYWLNSVRVDDVRASVTRLRTLGGRVLAEPHVGRHGEMVAVVADPLGAAFGLVELGPATTR